MPAGACSTPGQAVQEAGRVVHNNEQQQAFLIFYLWVTWAATSVSILQFFRAVSKCALIALFAITMEFNVGTLAILSLASPRQGSLRSFRKENRSSLTIVHPTTRETVAGSLNSILMQLLPAFPALVSSRSTSSAEQSPDESAKAHFQWRPSQMHAENTLACEKFRRLSNVCCIFIGQHFVAVDCLLPVGCGSLLDTWASSSGSRKGCTQQRAAASISHLLPLSHLGSHQHFHFAVLQGCEQMCTHRPFGNSRCFQCRNLSHSIPCLTQTRISQELQKGKQIFFDNRTSNHQRNCRRKSQLRTYATPSCLSSSS